MKRYAIAATAAFGLAGTAQAAITVYNDQASFTGAAGPVIVIEDFEDAPPASRDVQLSSYTGPGGEITFTAITSFPIAPNVVIATPPYNNFGAGVNPTTSTILTASGNENFEGVLTAPTSALGFNVFLNDSPFSVEFFSGATPLGTLTYDSPPVAGDNLGFAGIISDIPITRFVVLAVNGEQINTGVDNIRVAAAIPEPGTWAMMLIGFGAIGFSMRRSHSQLRSLAQIA